MPFIANTPESLIGRSDSKNPATTCRGITSSGRPCRRPILASDAGPSFGGRLGIAKFAAVDPRDENLYCWQHKDQATLSARSSPGPRISNTPILEERTSLDTLADRLGLVEAERKRTEKANKQKQKQDARPSAQSGGRPQPPKGARAKPKKELSCCFCFHIPLEEVPPSAPRPKPRPVQAPMAASMPSLAKPTSTSQSHHLGLGMSSASSGRNSHHSSHHSNSSQTSKYLSLIPSSASPQTASLLMAELAKPVSQLDEPGYIYMFWLTPESRPSEPAAQAARSLLAPPTSSRPRGERRPSDVLAAFADLTASAGATGSRGLLGPDAAAHPSKTILLKIGRANNVQRRLNEWTRQCGYNLSLIRYYPYLSSGSPVGKAVPRKMPHSHKVERLIHLELAGLGMRVADRGKCPACGREHREWFEVEASRKAVADVDEVVRRWVGWDESCGL